MTHGSAPKNKRKITSFEADDDVKSMLKAAQEDGLTLNKICNKALREHGVPVIRELLKEREGRAERWGSGASSKALRLVEEARKGVVELPLDGASSAQPRAKRNPARQRSGIEVQPTKRQGQ